jgi:histidinol-phosphate phosphatase family protein
MTALPNITKEWTLFLDRDGVINKRLPDDYVKTIAEFEFLDGALEAIQAFNHLFGVIVIVTNQQGIGKGIMSSEDLDAIHAHMLYQIKAAGGRVDHVFYCPKLAAENADCRKPNTGMGMEAQRMFPNINFQKSLMVGDSISDMEFGERLGTHCAFIGSDQRYASFDSLIHVARSITSK